MIGSDFDLDAGDNPEGGSFDIDLLQIKTN